jgi:hypothetical protein
MRLVAWKEASPCGNDDFWLTAVSQILPLQKSYYLTYGFKTM